MKVVLQVDVRGLGQVGDVLEVAGGFARNFLIPTGKACYASVVAVQDAELKKATRARSAEDFQEWAKNTVKKLNGIAITLKGKVSSGKKLFGSIAEKDIIKSIKEEYKIELEKEHIALKHHLKEVGDHEVPLSFGADIAGKITVKIEAE